MLFLEMVLSAGKKGYLWLPWKDLAKLGRHGSVFSSSWMLTKQQQSLYQFGLVLQSAYIPLGVYCIGLLPPQPLFPVLFSLPAFAGAVTAHLDCWISTFCPLRLCESHPSLQTSWLMLQHSVKASHVCTHHLPTPQQSQLSPLLSHR